MHFLNLWDIRKLNFFSPWFIGASKRHSEWDGATPTDERTRRATPPATHERVWRPHGHVSTPSPAHQHVTPQWAQFPPTKSTLFIFNGRDGLLQLLNELAPPLNAIDDHTHTRPTAAHGLVNSDDQQIKTIIWKEYSAISKEPFVGATSLLIHSIGRRVPMLFLNGGVFSLPT